MKSRDECERFFTAALGRLRHLYGDLLLDSTVKLIADRASDTCLDCPIQLGSPTCSTSKCPAFDRLLEIVGQRPVVGFLMMFGNGTPRECGTNTQESWETLKSGGSGTPPNTPRP